VFIFIFILLHAEVALTVSYFVVDVPYYGNTVLYSVHKQVRRL